MSKEKQNSKNAPPKEPKYFWFKLHDDFFEDDKIKLLEKMPNGEKYGWFLFKLICKSIKTEGLLRFSEKLPYSPKMLADITDTDIDVVRSALSAFDVCELIDIFEDGTYFIDLVPNNTGKESESAARMRRLRERKKGNLLPSHCDNKVMPSHCDVEKEKDIELDIEIEYNNNSAHTREKKTVENYLNQFGIPYGKEDLELRKVEDYDRIFMSYAQEESLCFILSSAEIKYYYDKLEGMLKNGYNFPRSHYEQILKMANEDRKVRQNE